MRVAAALAGIVLAAACGRVGFDPGHGGPDASPHDGRGSGSDDGRPDAHLPPGDGVVHDGPFVSDAVSANDATVAPLCEGDKCTCGFSGGCTLTCLQGHCEMSCMGDCTVICDAASCDLDCADGATCNLECQAGNCNATYSGGADGNVTCTHDCALTCSSGADCSHSCDQPATCSCSGFGCD